MIYEVGLDYGCCDCVTFVQAHMGAWAWVLVKEVGLSYHNRDP